MNSDRGIFPPHEDYVKETASGFHIERKVVESEGAVVGLVDWVDVALNSGDLGLNSHLIPSSFRLWEFHFLGNTFLT